MMTDIWCLAHWVNLVLHACLHHCSDVIISAKASRITGNSIVYSTVCSGADERKHQSPASLDFVRGIHRRPVNSPHKGPVTWKMLPFHDVFMIFWIFHFRHCITAGLQQYHMRLCITVEPPFLSRTYRPVSVQSPIPPSYMYGNSRHYHLNHWANHPWWRHQMETYSAFLALCERNPPDSPNISQWRETLMFSMICAWTNG